MNKNLLTILITCFLIAATISCKKSATSSIQHDDLTGRWRKTRIAIDTNGNGIMDNNELLAPSSYDSTHVLVFNSDGSGQITYMNTNVASFSWTLENNNTYLKIYYPGSINGLTIQHIDTLSSVSMTLRDTTGISVVWDLFTKQR